jgi:hypothetical protein
MATEANVADVVESIGHDGSENIYPDLNDPYCRRSFHIQEVILEALSRGYATTPIEANPISYVDDDHMLHGELCAMRDYLYKYVGVLIGTGVAGTPHAVAWNGKVVLDPNGAIYNVERFNIEQFYIISKI